MAVGFAVVIVTDNDCVNTVYFVIDLVKHVLVGVLVMPSLH